MGSLSLRNNWSFNLNKLPQACFSQDYNQLTLGKRQEPNVRREFNNSDGRDEAIESDSWKVENHKLPPLVAALKASAGENAASFHFPGHNRGEAAPSSLTDLIGLRPFLHDLPELPELDDLFAPNGPILEAQKQAADLFGASKTWFLVGGSTCGIQAAIMSTCCPGDTIILPRNAHISAVSAMILSGAVPKYFVPEYEPDWEIAGGITPLQVGKALKELEIEGRKPAAVLIVSPTYHGICSEINAISDLCHSHKIPLIVDEAHGAHFSFHQHLPSSALSHGADIVVQSTHKVLCSLTQSSMLHASGNLIDRDRISQCLQTLQSSSPSYLLLASLDAARAQISDNRETIFDEAIELAAEAKSMINKIPRLSLLDVSNFPESNAIDPLRITVGFQRLGLSGFEADDILSRDFGLVSELVGTSSMTLAFNLGTKREHVLRLASGLEYLSANFVPTDSAVVHQSAADFRNSAPFDDIDMILSPRDAFFARKRKVSVEECVGKICGELICPYPPGIPVLIPGEVITERALEYLLYVKRKGASISGAADHHLSSLVVCDT